MALGGARPGAGRPKGTNGIAAERAREYICKRVEEELEAIITKAIEQAKRGDPAARRDLFDRAWGKPREEHHLDVDVTLKIDV